MELSPLGFLEELLQAPRRDSWTTLIGVNDQFYSSNGWSCFDTFDESSSLGSTNPSFAEMLAATEPPGGFECHFSADQTYPFVDGYTGVVVPDIEQTSPIPTTQQEEYYIPVVEDEDQFGILGKLGFEERNNSCSKVEMEQQGSSSNNNTQVFNMGLCNGEKRSNKSKKLEGQPSKNLMAERRRRKRLNDRLSMLRSIVPKISKMDRTSILGDTIDYMKELLERINKLQEEESEEGSDTNQANLLTNLKDLKPNEVLVRNSPKFHVDRSEIDTRIDICCTTKPGLLLSKVNTLDALGLEIQQCVISCFNDFSMQASCSEVAEQRTLISPEDIKQALFRTAGYGGRCL